MIEFNASKACRLPAREYFEYILGAVDNARRRIWVSMFIFDIRPSIDLRGNVLELANHLVERNSAGVDVRVMLTGYLRTSAIIAANLSSGIYLVENGVSHKRIFKGNQSGTRMGSHAKYAIIDDEVIIGSQNWTDDGFNLNTEDSVILMGNSVDIISQEFLNFWSQSKTLTPDAIIEG